MWGLLVCDLAAIHFLHKEVSFAHVVPPHIHLAIGNSDVYTLHCSHQVIHQAFAVSAYNVDERVGWRCAVVDCHLQETRVNVINYIGLDEILAAQKQLLPDKLSHDSGHYLVLILLPVTVREFGSLHVTGEVGDGWLA